MKRHRINLVLACRLVARGWTIGENLFNQVMLCSPRGRAWRVAKDARGNFFALPTRQG